jgi:hypothetical protein
MPGREEALKFHLLAISSRQIEQSGYSLGSCWLCSSRPFMWELGMKGILSVVTP